MYRGVGFAFVLILLGFSSAWAQDSNLKVESVKTESTLSEDEEKQKSEEAKKSAAQTPKDKSVEKIEVTGSYIKRIDVEGPSPVVTIDQQQILATGTNTVSDFIRESAYFESSDDEGANEGYFRFHGQHGGNTLVLLNGMRIPKFGAPGRDFFNGVRSIPTNVIDRVEILKDGSSALYGSDAMAGAMNFITKKDYDGAEISVQSTVPEAGVGLEQNYTATYGQNFSKGNYFATVQYVKQDGYRESDIGSFYNQNRFSGFASEATFLDAKQKPIVEFDNGNICDTDKKGKPVVCENSTLTFQQVRNPKENLSALLSGRVDISPDINVNMIGMYNRRQRTDISLPRGIYYNRNQPGFSTFSVKPGLPSEKAIIDRKVDPGKITGFEYRPNEEMDLSRDELVEDSYTVQSKVQGYFLDSWSWNVETSAGFQQERTKYLSGVYDMAEIQRQYNAGNFDPTLPYRQKAGNVAALNAASVQPIEQYDSQMYASRVYTSGELFEFSDLWGVGGPMAMAIGFDGQWESSQDRNDPGFGNAQFNLYKNPNLSGSRRVQSAFLELSAYPIQSLELQIAGRYDAYSDVGEAFNPKVALGFRPSNKILFRTSWGTNFHAPSVRNMIQPPAVMFENFTDQNHINCDNKGNCRDRFIVPVTRYKDPNIGPERGVHYNFGTVIQPNRQWTFTIDQWNFEGTDTIAKLYGDWYTLMQHRSGDAALENMGVVINRDPNTGDILSMSAPEIVNMGERTIRGLDLKVDWDQKVNVIGLPMNFGLSSTHSHFLVYKTKRTDISPVEFREDIEWQNTSIVSLSSGRNSYRVAAKTAAGATNARIKYPTYTEYDVTYTLGFNWGGKFTAGIKNVLNSQPPIDWTANAVTLGSIDDNFSPLRRRYFVGYSQTF